MLERQRLMLRDKQQALAEMYAMCDSAAQRTLVSDLLTRFNYFDSDLYGYALNSMADYILSFRHDIDKTLIVAFCHDSESDSSLEVLNSLKNPLAEKCGRKIMDLTRFDHIHRMYNKGYRHFFAVDEFAGSGQTAVNLFNEFKRKNLTGATLNICVLAGMQQAIHHAAASGYDLNIVYVMNRGISDCYEGDQLTSYVSEMASLESKLADKINETSLSDHSFGYGRAESLFMRVNGNVPNNVFPLFWWKAYKGGSSRKPILTRSQNGY